MVMPLSTIVSPASLTAFSPLGKVALQPPVASPVESRAVPLPLLPENVPPITGGYPVRPAGTSHESGEHSIGRVVYVGGQPFALGDSLHIARDGLSTVHRAWSGSLNQSIVVKAYRASSPEERAVAQQRVEMEARRLIKIRAAGLKAPEVFGVSSLADHEASIIMEELEGSNLQAMLSNPQRKYSFDHIQTAVQVVKLVNDLYSKAHILHRDLKAAQFIINTSSEVFLLDFGSSVDRDNINDGRHIRTGATRGFVAPERLSATSAGDETAMTQQDIFALGQVLRQILGRNPNTVRPADGRTVVRVQPINGIPKALNDIVLMMLSPQPEHRPSFQEVLSVFTPFLPLNISSASSAA
ncbi:MAG: protein kinase [Deltaproteobacteria bacterium]|nr:MAG: protein kinase [Deltaproteobacteria bacterium]